jgi:ATP-dependent exoDNAse (exonuclease V) beta subunit
VKGSAVVQAGAGTGKTHSLVTLCLNLLGGIGRDEPLPPAQLWAVTFTEKAAAELKGRLRQRVDALAEGGAELAGPDPAFWRKVRRDLVHAQVGTIHSLCAQILRRHAAAAGIDPGFSMLDEAEGPRVLREACESVSLRALEGALGPEVEGAARRLCTEMGLRAQGDFGSGLADELASLLSALGESGRSARQIVEETRGLSPQAARDDDARARKELLAAMEALRSAVQQVRSGKTALSAADSVAAFRPGALGYAPGELAQAWPLLRPACAKLPSRVGPLAEAVGAARDAFEALLDADAGVRGSDLARDLALVAEGAAARHREEKARAGALDFDDLTRLCRDLLAQHPAAREAERRRVGVLLVDEFQDTSRPQLQLFTLLAPDAGMMVVGDRKQSIYEFRGADVAGAQAFAGAMLAQGAERHLLQQSRRSQPALVDFQNLLFSRALSPAGRPFDTPFSTDDALTAFRPAGAACCAELLDVSGAGVEAEAELVARRISALLAPGAPERVFDRDERPRPVRGGDIAILLRRFTNLEAFRRALLRRRIPHLVYKGRGFHEAREVVDLVALLTVATDPDHALALAAVLRSPLGPVSDEGLVLLARGPRASGESGRGLRLRALLDPPALAPDDAEVVERLGRLIGALQREADRLGPAALLEAALAETDYVAACAGGLYGEQAAANVEKLLSLARAAELRGSGVRAFLGTMRTLAGEEAREAEAAVVEERDPHAVRLLTVHAAKGLEFPVVFVPECATPSAQAGAERVLLEPDLGFALKARGADGKRRWGPHGRAVADRKLERELSQSRRLLYVAVTRARDLVVLSGRAARQQESWRALIDQVAAEAEQRGLLRILRDGFALPEVVADRAPVDPERLAELQPAEHPDVQRLLFGGPRPAGSVSAPVTQIADAAACARRYQLLHELRLEERPDAEPSLPDPLGPEPGASATALGTLAHRLLELLPLQLGGLARRAELARLLALEGEDPAQHGEVLDAACDFLDSPLGKRMAAARPERLQRELPFTLRLAAEGAPELLLRGQIDALLLDSDAATVVDYKLSRARDASHYAAQLDAYALAASELVQGALPVRTGIVFLRTKGAPYVERPAAGAAGLAAVRTRLLAAAQAIAHGRSTGAWPKVDPSRCRELGCGFLNRCHGTLPLERIS